jgi:hypothetical protein
MTFTPIEKKYWMERSFYFEKKISDLGYNSERRYISGIIFLDISCE